MYELNDHDRVLLRLKQRTERDKKRYVKITTLLMLHEGYTPAQVAEALGVEASTIYRYHQRFRERGNVQDYLHSDYRGSSSALDSSQLGDLCEELTEKLYRSAEEVRAFIHNTFGLLYSVRHVRRFCKKLGFSFKKTSLVPGKADPVEQERFLREVLEPLLERTRERRQPLYFCDAAHPQYNTRAAFGWIARGHRYTMPTTAGRHRVNLNAALNVHDPSDLICLQAARIDAEATIALFELLEQRHRSGIITVICDNARYYRCRALDQWLRDHRIVLVHLPPYSPNLNLIERLWKYMRKVLLDTTYYATLQGFKAAITSFFDSIDERVDDLRSLLQPNFHIEDAVAF